MNIDSIYLIAIISTIITNYVLLKYLYKRSIIFIIGMYLCVYGTWASFVTYMFFRYGTLHIIWIIPSAIGLLVGLMFLLHKKIKKPLYNTTVLGNKVASGELGEVLPELDVDNEISSLIHSINKISKNTESVISNIRDASQQVAYTSSEVSNSSQTLAQGANEQALRADEITSSVAEIRGKANQNSENAVSANSLAKESRQNAEECNSQMAELVAAMSDINKSAEQIKKVVTVIEDIAFQTNLLALNANVEAARAGEYGKGFTVVAEEVRSLAGRSAHSAKETTAMVEESIKNVSRGNELVKNTAKQLGVIVEGTTKVGALIEEIASTSREQAGKLELINTSLGQIDDITQSNAATAEESASASEELAAQAKELEAIVSQFKLSRPPETSTASPLLSSSVRRSSFALPE